MGGWCHVSIGATVQVLGDVWRYTNRTEQVCTCVSCVFERQSILTVQETQTLPEDDRSQMDEEEEPDGTRLKDGHFQMGEEDQQARKRLGMVCARWGLGRERW
jgi:hypothetical protein